MDDSIRQAILSAMSPALGGAAGAKMGRPAQLDALEAQAVGPGPQAGPQNGPMGGQPAPQMSQAAFSGYPGAGPSQQQKMMQQQKLMQLLRQREMERQPPQPAAPPQGMPPGMPPQGMAAPMQ